MSEIKSQRVKDYIKKKHTTNWVAYYDIDGKVCNSMLNQSMCNAVIMAEEDMEEKFFDIINTIFTKYSIPQEGAIRCDINYLLNII